MEPFKFAVHYLVGESLHFKTVTAFNKQEVALILGIEEYQIKSCKVIDGI